MEDNNYSKIPNDFLEKMIYTSLSDTQQRIINLIVRKTFGFHKDNCNLSYTFIAKNTKTSIRNVENALKDLRQRKIIIHFGQTERRENIWGINTNYSQWNTKTGSEEPERKKEEPQGAEPNENAKEKPPKPSRPAQNQSLDEEEIERIMQEL